jgi:hypothetical protein
MQWIDDLCCRNIVESAKRARECPITKKELLTTDVIKKAMDNLHVRLNFNLSKEKGIKYIIFSDDYIKILISRSNTDIYRKGTMFK